MGSIYIYVYVYVYVCMYVCMYVYIYIYRGFVGAEGLGFQVWCFAVLSSGLATCFGYRPSLATRLSFRRLILRYRLKLQHLARTALKRQWQHPGHPEPRTPNP